MGSQLLIALGLVLVIEGLAYALFPALLKRLIAAILAADGESLRLMGVGSIAAGVAIVWFAQHI
jgi:hypothetical protein